MSSWYVGDKQISAIANSLHEIAEDLDRETWDKMPRSAETFARSLSDLNRFALKERYPESWEQLTSNEPFSYSVDEKLLNVEGEEAQLYKSIACFLYQCSEGYAPEHETYKQMKALHSELAHRIAMRWADAMGARWE